MRTIHVQRSRVAAVLTIAAAGGGFATALAALRTRRWDELESGLRIALLTFEPVALGSGWALIDTLQRVVRGESPVNHLVAPTALCGLAIAIVALTTRRYEDTICRRARHRR
jgi:hypothetical protein